MYFRNARPLLCFLKGTLPTNKKKSFNFLIIEVWMYGEKEVFFLFFLLSSDNIFSFQLCVCVRTYKNKDSLMITECQRRCAL